MSVPFSPSHAGSIGPGVSPSTLSPRLPWQDWDIVERREEASSWDERTVMIPRKLQEGPRADSARKAPSLLTRSPVGGDAAGQRKEGECFCQARLVPVTMDVVMAIWALGPVFLWWVRIFGLQVTETETG